MWGSPALPACQPAAAGMGTGWADGAQGRARGERCFTLAPSVCAITCGGRRRRGGQQHCKRKRGQCWHHVPPLPVPPSRRVPRRAPASQSSSPLPPGSSLLPAPLPNRGDAWQPGRCPAPTCGSSRPAVTHIPSRLAEPGPGLPCSWGLGVGVSTFGEGSLIVFPWCLLSGAWGSQHLRGTAGE